MIEDLKKQNVTCTFTGTKKVGGVDTGEPCIVVGVAQKKYVYKLPPEEIIPRSVDGVPTDVIQIGPFFAQNQYDRFRPMVGGISIHDKDEVGSGTLGIIVRDVTDGQLVGLTNNHVIGNFYDGHYGFCDGWHVYIDDEYGNCISYMVGIPPYGTPFVQQPEAKPPGGWEDYAQVKRAVPYRIGELDNTVDGSIFALRVNDGSTEIYGIHRGPFPFASRDEYPIGTPVIKSGRTSGVTPPPVATIIAVDASISVNFSGDGGPASMWFADQIIMWSSTLGFTLPGDSGAAILAVIDGQYKVIGLNFAGGSGFTVANHIDNVSRLLRIEAWDGVVVFPGYSTKEQRVIDHTLYERIGPTFSAVTHDKEDPLLSETISEHTMLYEAILTGWGATVTDMMAYVDHLADVLGVPIHEWFQLIDAQTNNWQGREIVPDNLHIWDLLAFGGIILDTITETLDINDTTDYVLMIAVLEYLGFNDLAAAMRSSLLTISDRVSLVDAMDRWFSIEAESVFCAEDTTEAIRKVLEIVGSHLNLEEALSVLNTIGKILTESISFTEMLLSNGLYYSKVYDGLRMGVTIELGGEIWECYVLNTPRLQPSVYSGFDFNSYCVFENRAFGANNTGIYELTGDTDVGEPIHTGVVFSNTDFGAPNKKRFRHGYLGVDGGQVVMSFETEDGTRQAYNVDADGKLMASHALKSKVWKLSAVDYESLRNIKLIPIVLAK